MCDAPQERLKLTKHRQTPPSSTGEQRSGPALPLLFTKQPCCFPYLLSSSTHSLWSWSRWPISTKNAINNYREPLNVIHNLFNSVVSYHSKSFWTLQGVVCDLSKVFSHVHHHTLIRNFRGYSLHTLNMAIVQIYKLWNTLWEIYPRVFTKHAV